MDTVIVQLPEQQDDHTGEFTERPRLLHLGPGETADFGRGGPDSPVQVPLPDPGVSRRAGQITAAEDYWRLSNYSGNVTYVVENMEGAGEHIKVAPGRLGAPVPFEFSRVVLPSRDGEVHFKVFAPEHMYLDGGLGVVRSGEPTQSPFTLDHTAKYFMVLLALCEPRLRDPSSGAVPGVSEILDRLRAVEGCQDLTRSAVNYHIEYLATVKLRLRNDGERATGPHHKRAELVALALRFDLVREEHLTLLRPARPGRSKSSAHD
ncbi:serine/threonine protein kinase [Streptomyces sp. 891-h]|uniref:serine/threonine protein kinase n=1 Tax=Streptomyces sp. 891-h TaxID=2720714 RepID=UPI001FAAE811|nr:serine/threonine protein kinase [Streptomyces sp. 891-h]UNZ20215.1 serine/threonine protein kinase [Streptomyces sp. 891-h]